MLACLGVQVITAMDGDDAYSALEEDTWPDIVFLDYNLEVGDSGVTVRTPAPAWLPLMAATNCLCHVSWGVHACVFSLSLASVKRWCHLCLQVLKKLKATFGSTDIPIVMCTAMSAASTELTECRALGAADVLLKPYDRDKMVQMVDSLVGNKVRTHTHGPRSDLRVQA